MINCRQSLNPLRLLFIIGLLASLAISAQAQRWQITWSAEFDGAAGARVAARKWSAEIGGWGQALPMQRPFFHKRCWLITCVLTGVRNRNRD